MAEIVRMYDVANHEYKITKTEDVFGSMDYDGDDKIVSEMIDEDETSMFLQVK